MDVKHVEQVAKDLAAFVRFKRSLIKDLTQVELAKKARISRYHLVNIENTGSNISIAMAARLFDALETSFSDFGSYVENLRKDHAN